MGEEKSVVAIKKRVKGFMSGVKWLINQLVPDYLTDSLLTENVQVLKMELELAADYANT